MKTTEEIRKICHELEEAKLESYHREEFFELAPSLSHIDDIKDQRAIWTCMNKLDFHKSGWFIRKGESPNVFIKGGPRHVKRILWEAVQGQDLPRNAPLVQVSGAPDSVKPSDLATPLRGTSAHELAENYKYVQNRMKTRRGAQRVKVDPEGYSVDDRISRILDTVRREQNITQENFAAMLDCDLLRLRGLFSGKVKNWRAEELALACVALEIDPRRLLKFTPPKADAPAFGESSMRSPATKFDENGN